MTLEKVNELATQLEVVVNGSETDTKTVTQILSHMSEIEITNSQIVEVSFRNCFHQLQYICFSLLLTFIFMVKLDVCLIKFTSCIIPIYTYPKFICIYFRHFQEFRQQ